MRWRYANCRRAEGANPDADNNRVCWELFLYFVERLVIRSTQLKYDGEREIGWQDSMEDKTKGLRVWIYGFACAQDQTVPLVIRIGEKINSWEAFQSAMDYARPMMPDGGTCPGAAIERSVGQIMANDLISRPYKAALILTDGVFYDGTRSGQAAQGLFYFGVLTYALGIAIPEKNNNQGLTPEEIVGQRQQLLAFAQNDPTRVKNFGAEGINILDSIAQAFVEQIPEDIRKHFPRLFIKPYYCDFANNNERCLNLEPANFPTGLYCKWIPYNLDNPEGNGQCVDKCPYTNRAACLTASKCEWFEGFCRPTALSSSG